MSIRKRIMYFIPAIILFIFYITIGIVDSFAAINPFVWFLVCGLFVAGLVGLKHRIISILLGFIAGLCYIWMSTINTGQIINIELPFGIALCSYYLIVNFIIK